MDLRLTADLKDWIEERPQLTAVLRSLRSSPEADMIIQRLARFMARRSPPKAPVGMLTIWESEIRAIAAEASGRFRSFRICSAGWFFISGNCPAGSKRFGGIYHHGVCRCAARVGYPPVGHSRNHNPCRQEDSLHWPGHRRSACCTGIGQVWGKSRYPQKYLQQQLAYVVRL